MVTSSPFVIILSPEERSQLTVSANAVRRAHREVLRAQIILAAAVGTSNAAIAADLGLHIDTVRKWRRRFSRHRLAGLKDLAPARPSARFHRRSGCRGQGVGV